MPSHHSRPRDSLIFIGFDLEEAGLFGSRYFVAHSPVPLERVKLFITADMISRSFAGVCDSHVFVMGTENAPGLRPWILQAAADRPLSVDVLGADLLVLNRSDYGPFRGKSIPFLFFTTGENPRYHTTADTPETLDYPKFTAISRMISQVVKKAVDAPELPRWQSSPDNPFAEAVAIRQVLEILVKNSEKLKVGRPQLFLMNNTLAQLDGIVARGKITPEERAESSRHAGSCFLRCFDDERRWPVGYLQRSGKTMIESTAQEGRVRSTGTRLQACYAIPPSSL